MDKVKQVIVMRRYFPDGDGKRELRKGKIAAQASHASMAFMTRRIQKGFQFLSEITSDSIKVPVIESGAVLTSPVTVPDTAEFKHVNVQIDPMMSIIQFRPAEFEWINTAFTKVVVYVDDEESLLEIHQKALDAKLESHLICDSGLTEFGGVPTYTAVGIGPDYSSRIDPITSHLKLL